jgi:hypothetical protein
VKEVGFLYSHPPCSLYFCAFDTACGKPYLWMRLNLAK